MISDGLTRVNPGSPRLSWFGVHGRASPQHEQELMPPSSRSQAGQVYYTMKIAVVGLRQREALQRMGLQLLGLVEGGQA